MRAFAPLQIAAFVLFVALGCTGPGDGVGRVLIVGIDGASLRIIDPMLAQGRLPTLARLRADGASGPLRSELPLASPSIWNSIATGKRAEDHGIEDFTYRDANGATRLYLGNHRRVQALWNIASDRGLQVGVVNWWNTFPPDRVRGVVVSDHAQPGRTAALGQETGAALPIGGPTVFPPAWQARVAAIHDQVRVLEPGKDLLGDRRDLPEWVDFEDLSRFPPMDAAATRIALEVESELRPDLLMVLLPGIDRVSHHLWAGVEPEGLYPDRFPMSNRDWRAAGDALRRYYDYTDALLATLIARFDADDLVIVLSDHGFHPAVLPKKMLTGHHHTANAIDGVLFARGPRVAPGASSAGTSIYQIAPTVLAWMDLAVADDMAAGPADFLTGAAPERIASYEGPVIERLEAGQSGSESELLEELRALGYVE